jgi:hypothetical protein
LTAAWMRVSSLSALHTDDKQEPHRPPHQARWEHVRLADVTAMAVKQWLDKLPFGAAPKVRTRNTVSKLLGLAMLWEYIPVSRNPMELVRVKGSTKRQKAIVFRRQFLCGQN